MLNLIVEIFNRVFVSFVVFFAYGIFVLINCSAGRNSLIEFAGNDMMTFKLVDINNCIEENRLSLFCHICRRRRETPMQEVGMATDGDGSIALGTFATRYDFCIRRIQIAPLASNQTCLITLGVAIVFILYFPHRNHIWKLLLAHFCIFLCACRSWAIGGGYLHLIRTFEDGTLGIHVVSMTKKAETIPVVFHTDIATCCLAFVCDGDDRTVKVLWEILGWYQLAESVIFNDCATWLNRSWVAINDGYIIVV